MDNSDKDPHSEQRTSHAEDSKEEWKYYYVDLSKVDTESENDSKYELNKGDLETYAASSDPALQKLAALLRKTKLRLKPQLLIL